MTKLASQRADIRVTECRGGGFVVHVGAEMYAACASPYDVAHAMATLLAERDDGHAASPARPAGPPLPASSGNDPVPAVVARPKPAGPVALAGSPERMRATANLVAMAVLMGLGAVVGV